MTKDFQLELFNYIQSRMSGSSDLDEFCYELPSKRFILGSLAPKDEHQCGDIVNDLVALSDNERGSIKARQLRVSLLFPTSSLLNEQEIGITIQGNLYYKVNCEENCNQESEDTNDGAQKILPSRWKRIGFQSVNSFKIRIDGDTTYDQDVDFGSAIEGANLDSHILKRVSDDTWKGRISIHAIKYPGEKILLHFYLTNTGVSNKKEKSSFDYTLFNCSMNIDLGNVMPSEFLDEYRYEDNIQRYYYDFRTINCQAEWLEKGPKYRLATKNYAVFMQPNC